MSTRGRELDASMRSAHALATSGSTAAIASTASGRTRRGPGPGRVRPFAMAGPRWCPPLDAGTPIAASTFVRHETSIENNVVKEAAPLPPRCGPTVDRLLENTVSTLSDRSTAHDGHAHGTECTCTIGHAG